jgi:hypothetical protein
VRILDGLMRELHRLHHGEAVAEQIGHRFEELDVEPGLEDVAEERDAQFEARPRNGGLGTGEPGLAEDERGDAGESSIHHVALKVSLIFRMICAARAANRRSNRASR